MFGKELENRLNSAAGGMFGEKLEMEIFEPSYFQKFSYKISF
jgi:hypothetical protein